MDDAQVRREYFRRFILSLIATVVVAAVLFFPAILVHPVHKKPFASWLLLTSGFAVMAIVVACIHGFARRNKPLFTRSEKEKPISLSTFIIIFLLSYASAAILPEVFKGSFDFRYDLIFSAAFFASVLPPTIWFLKWRLNLIESLPNDSSLIEPPPRLLA